MINLHVEGIQQQVLRQFHQSGIDRKYIYLGKWFHFGKLYSLVRSQMTSLWMVSNKRCFSGSWCIFHTLHPCSFLEMMSASLSAWHFLIGISIPNVQIGLALSINLGMLYCSAGAWSTSQAALPVALRSFYLSGLLLSDLFTKQTFIKYLLWTGLVLGNMGSTTLTMTLLSHLCSQALRVH